ncbi:cation diffusion facilitator family transporter [Sphingobacterium psychroaquaticum]|uniref:Cation diffusion facilitator family transporter n=1 Tax=Sphingobacterium psychroaquaticum TaxID=561061 RepID=A0A1X7IHF3_9SPHI|nr:cation diffusion facilitator family transporter [Sphingobacterium psychroaquaticum]SMG14086.1 cation diffusion facilitator family transporter [Sphingobacterium psychroaquaticum]
MSNEESAIKTTYYSIFTSFTLAIVKWLGGIFGNSYALIADAIESTADIFSSFLVLLGLKYAKRPADSSHPYGHGRIEPLVTFIVVIFLVLSAFVIASESIKNIRTPHELPKAWTLIILGGIIIWKEISFRIIMRKSKLLNSTSLKAEAWHQRSDAITSVAAFIGIAIAIFCGEGYESADDWAALFASGFILYNCYGIFRPALAEIMDEHRYEELEEEVRQKSRNVAGVLLIEKCYIRKIGMHFQIDLHAVVDPNLTVREGHEIAHALKDYLIENLANIGNVFVHIEPFEEKAIS